MKSFDVVSTLDMLPLGPIYDSGYILFWVLDVFNLRHLAKGYPLESHCCSVVRLRDNQLDKSASLK